MNLKKSILIVILFFSELLFAGVEKNKFESYLDRFSVAGVVLISSGEVLNFSDSKILSCGINYSSVMIHSLKGDINKEFNFSSKFRFKIGQKYLIFVASDSDYLPDYMTAAPQVEEIGEKIEERSKDCKKSLKQPYLYGDDVYEITPHPDISKGGQWVKILDSDKSIFLIDEQISHRYKDINGFGFFFLPLEEVNYQ